MRITDIDVPSISEPLFKIYFCRVTVDFANDLLMVFSQEAILTLFSLLFFFQKWWKSFQSQTSSLKMCDN